MADFLSACKHGNIDELKNSIKKGISKNYWTMGLIDAGIYSKLNVVKFILRLRKARKYINIEDCFLSLFCEYYGAGTSSPKIIRYMREQVIKLYGEKSRKTLERLFDV